MTEKEILKKAIDIEFDNFFEFSTEDKSQVSSTSCKLFAEHMVNLETRLKAMLESCQDIESEPVLYQSRMKFDVWKGYWTQWEDCSKETYENRLLVPRLHDWIFETRKLYISPQPNQTAELEAKLAKVGGADKVRLIDAINGMEYSVGLVISQHNQGGKHT